MQQTQLTFFCELDKQTVLEFFQTPGVIEDVLELNAGVSLAIIDLSSERAQVVQMLNRAGVSTTAWLVLPREQGYYFNLDNYPAAMARYTDFQRWTTENGLSWSAVGLDIEPDHHLIQKLAERKLRAIPGLIPILVGNILNHKRYRRAFSAYRELVKRMHADGYLVESYQFPILADERSVRSTLIQRLTGIVDVHVDREVWMLYSSYFQQRGVGILWSYAPQAEAIGLGSTGGGVDIGEMTRKALDWESLTRDLRLAWYWSDHLYIFSLEGCVRQGYLKQLKSIIWDQPILFPTEVTAPINAGRRTLQVILWLIKNFVAIFAGLLGIFIVIETLRRYYRNRK